jgi:UDP-N-acetylmuramoylalanine--D-glutamate ligase
MMKSPRKVLVLGAGESGQAAAICLRKEGRLVTILDEGVVPPDRLSELRDSGINVVTGAESIPSGPWHLGIVSPGFPPGHPWLLRLDAEGVPVWSELELGWSRSASRMISVTGSNGKSTLVRLINHILTFHGIRAIEAGNCGPPLCRVSDERVDWIVVEASSFQLERVRAFRSEVGILLNFQPNHLDRHGDMEAYLDIKSRIFAAALETDLCLVPAPLLEELRRRVGRSARWESFGTDRGARWNCSECHVWDSGKCVARIPDSRFDNPIMGHTVAAAVAAVGAAGVGASSAVDALPTFQFLPHRMETVGIWEGVTFINDSKSTSLSATAAALDRCGKPVRLIAGGISKESELTILSDRLAEKAEFAFVIGRDGRRLADAWRGFVPVTVHDSLEEAFAAAVQDACPGDTVLLSPGCTSFDQFESYSARGRHFRKLIDTWRRGNALAGKE